MGAQALLDRYPQLEGALPRAELGDFPTPVEEARPLGKAVGLRLWIKRDDRSGKVYGGNKVRKLELLLGRALSDGRTRVATVGAYGSHHSLATCIYARQMALGVSAVLCPQPVTPHVLDNLLAAHGTGAEVIPVPTFAAAGPRLVAESLRRRAMLISPGGSSPLGALGYVGAAFELAEQVRRRECPEPERMVVALGSSGSMAGLVLGVRLAGLRSEVVGVRVTPLIAANEVTVATLASRASALLHRLTPEIPLVLFSPAEIRVVHGQIGEGYGHETEEGRRVTELSAALRGPELDPTYTAKAMAGLLSESAERPPRGGPVLFWSTLSSASLAPLLEGVTPEGLPPELRRLYE